MGIMAALLEREKTGKGGLVETSLFETAVGWMAIPVARMKINGTLQQPAGSGSPGIVPYQAFQTRDGWLVIGGGNDALFVKLTQALGLAEVGKDERYRTNRGRVEHRESTHPSASRAECAKYTNAPSFLHCSIAMASPTRRCRRSIRSLPMPKPRRLASCRRVRRVPYRRSACRCASAVSVPHIGAAAPALGEHTEEILSRFRFSKK